MKILTFVAGGLLVLAGVWCFAHPGVTFLSLAFVLGCAMVFSGLCNILCFFVTRKHNESAAWLLADGILTSILGVIVLQNLLITDSFLILFFGMWIMFTGCLRIVAAIGLRKAKTPGWLWGLLAGALCVLAGVYAFIDPLIAGLAMVVLLGVFFILQGVNMVIVGLQMKAPRRAETPEEYTND